MNVALNLAIVVWAITSGSAAIPDSVMHSQAPDYEIERARRYIVSRLGEEVGATCRVETRCPIVKMSSHDGFIGISGWELRARFRPNPSRDLECTFVIDDASKQEYAIIIHEDRHVAHVGEVPDCRNRPELCAISVERASAIEIGRSRGIDPRDPEYFATLELSGAEPGIVWRISSRAEGEGYGRLVIVDAVTGDIREDRENKPCGE